MPSEFEDPDLAPRRAAGIGRRQFLRWALVLALIAAASANLDALLAALGGPAPGGATPSGPGAEHAFALEFLGAIGPPFLAIGAGLAIAATVELRRGTEAAGSGTVLALWLTWGLLGLAALGLFWPAGNP